MARSRAKPDKYLLTNAVEAYTLRDAQIQYIGTYFDLRREESPRDFLAFSNRRWLKLDNLAHVNATDLVKQVPPRDYLHCPDDITHVDPALLLSEEVFAKGAHEDATEDAALEDNESIPANVINWIDDQQKRLHEAHICELLAKSPHPNIVTYYGCDVRGGYVLHLILEYLPHKLADRFLDKSKPLDVEQCIRGIEAGLNHIHSLGLVHLDIAPRNIMLREDDTPVIIDFDLAQRDHERLGENFHAGEPYYHSYDTHASPQLDIDALDLLKEYVCSFLIPGLSSYTVPRIPRYLMCSQSLATLTLDS
jgi:serine/threonine protein kinase